MLCLELHRVAIIMRELFSLSLSISHPTLSLLLFIFRSFPVMIGDDVGFPSIALHSSSLSADARTHLPLSLAPLVYYLCFQPAPHAMKTHDL